MSHTVIHVTVVPAFRALYILPPSDDIVSLRLSLSAAAKICAKKSTGQGSCTTWSDVEELTRLARHWHEVAYCGKQERQQEELVQSWRGLEPCHSEAEAAGRVRLPVAGVTGREEVALAGYSPGKAGRGRGPRHWRR